jgi:hypothetical protein
MALPVIVPGVRRVSAARVDRRRTIRYGSIAGQQSSAPAFRLRYRLGRRFVVAASAERECVQRLFHGLVPAEVIEAYDRLLAQDGCAKDQADVVVGDSGLVAASRSGSPRGMGRSEG